MSGCNAVYAPSCCHLLTRACRGYFTNRLGGGYFPPSPAPNSGTTGPIYKIQKAFVRSGNNVEGNLILLTTGSPMMSQVSSKSKCLKIWRVWFCHALRPYKMEISQCNYMNRVWGTCNRIVSFSRVYSRSRSLRSRVQGKIKLKILYLRRVIHVFRLVFRQEREKLL